MKRTRGQGGAVLAAAVALLFLVTPVAHAGGATTGPYTDDPAAVSALPAGWRQQILDGTNALRKKAGVPALQLCDTLNDSSQGWSNYMVANGLFAHEPADGSREWDRMVLAGYMPQIEPSGENLSWGQFTTADVIQIWTSDPFHYGNMVDPRFVDMGVGVARSANGNLYWTANYGDGGTCTRFVAKYAASATIEASPGTPAEIGPISFGSSTVKATLRNGAYGTVKLFSEPAACTLPHSKGRQCSRVTLDLVTKGPDGKNLYSSSAPVVTDFTCEPTVCPPIKAKGAYNPVRDYRAYPLKISLKRNGVYLPERIAPPCQRIKGATGPTGTLGTALARKRGFCVDVYAFTRVDGVLSRPALFVEDPRFLAMSR